jgi:magnesium transporter
VIKFHIADKGTLYSGPPDLTHPVPPEVLWIDICSPTRAEEAELERALGLDVPTREEISEIEQTSRLYRSNGLLYMTAVIIARSDSLAPTTVPVTFIATPERVITVRYDTPTSFEIFQARCEKRTMEIASASDVLTGLLGTIVDRAADILELVGADLEALNREIFLYTGAKAKRSSANRAIAYGVCGC